MIKKISVKSSEREEMIDITGRLADIAKGSDDGVLFVFTQHTTCGLTINENADPDVQTDMLSFLRNLIPQFYEDFRHAEQNSDAHIKSSLVGSSVAVPYSDGRLQLGRWQAVYLC